MTLEEAIELAERAYKESRNGLQYALKRGETKFAERCKKDAEEYGQFAAWLRELKERREHGLMQGCYGCRHNPFEEEAYCRMCKRMCLDKYEKDGENHDT